MEEQANLLAEAVSVFRTGAVTAAAAVRPALAAVAATVTRCAGPRRCRRASNRHWRPMRVAGKSSKGMPVGNGAHRDG
jgi:hypothetical protein